MHYINKLDRANSLSKDKIHLILLLSRNLSCKGLFTRDENDQPTLVSPLS